MVKDKKLTVVAQSFHSALARGDQLPTPRTAALAVRPKCTQPVIEESFRWNSSDNAPPGLTKLQLPFNLQARGLTAEPNPASWLAQRKAGEEREFQKQNYEEALAHYQLVLASGPLA